MPSRRLKQCLDSHGISYTRIDHSPAYTAQEIAHASHISGKNIAKTVISKVNGEMAMIVLPASDMVVLDFLRDALDTKDVELATESEFRDRFPECELGAMPPFGNLFEMETFVSERLTHDNQIAFNSGTHTELVQMSYQDFAQLVTPRVIRLSYADSALM
ncbi:MAG: YbaK/EbsC family protein [Planctomycetota bacterium]|nr:YbaK/EbsC family protein [Planctomycetota bacterium]